jgi:hypothetical protein
VPPPAKRRESGGRDADERRRTNLRHHGWCSSASVGNSRIGLFTCSGNTVAAITVHVARIQLT